MAVKIVNFIPSKFVEAAQTTQYTANNVRAQIDKVTVTNTSATSVTFSCNLCIKDEAPSASNQIIKDKQIAAGETYLCPELVGHSIEAGGLISTLASATDSLVIRASGREIT